ncbi:hypothetical protein LXL04_020792 [Taraxacum kok-saghyz]
MNQDEVDAMLRTCGEEEMEISRSTNITGCASLISPVGENVGAVEEVPNSEDALEHNIVSVQPQYTWTQMVGDKLYKGQLFDSFEDAFGYYKDYARRSRFEIRKATTKISKNGGGYSHRNAHYAPETYKPGQIQMHSTPERNKSVYAFVRFFYLNSGRGVAQRCGDHQNGKTMAQTVFGKPETGSKAKTEVKSPKISTYTDGKLGVLGSFENSYIPENPRTSPISYISQTVIPFKKPTSEPSKTFLIITIR